MRKFLRKKCWRALRKFARWTTTGKNFVRLQQVQAWWQVNFESFNDINALRDRYSSLIADSNSARLLTVHERKIHSQFGEDGLLLYFFSKIGAPKKAFIELGIEDATECNAANLALHFGWSGLFIEGSEQQSERARNFYHKRHGIAPDRVQVRTHFVTRDNVNELFGQYGLKGEIDLLSIDIDGADYWIWEAVTIVSPRVVVMEFNASFGPTRRVTVPYEPAFDLHKKHPSGWYHGASLAALTKLANKKGYFLAGCDSSGANAFFVRRDIGEGKVAEFTPAQAFHPSAPRMHQASLDEQWNQIKHLSPVEI